MSFIACAAMVALSFLRMDVPIAQYFWNVGHLRSPLNTAFGSTLILSAESAVILFTVVARLVRGRISAFAETLAMACLVSMCAYVVNDHILKVFFGVLNPADVVHGAGHSFNFWTGSESSSFPSGHMVLAGAFAGVFMRLHKASIWLFSALLLIAAGLLLVGDWHFSAISSRELFSARRREFWLVKDGLPIQRARCCRHSDALARTSQRSHAFSTRLNVASIRSNDTTRT